MPVHYGTLTTCVPVVSLVHQPTLALLHPVHFDTRFPEKNPIPEVKVYRGELGCLSNRDRVDID